MSLALPDLEWRNELFEYVLIRGASLPFYAPFQDLVLPIVAPMAASSNFHQL